MSEAAPLADVFVFRLMFRLYSLPQKLSDCPDASGSATNRSVSFYEKKRLLDAFAARKYLMKAQRNGKVIDYTKYLMISALTLDTRTGACSALAGSRCSIYERRPSGCRSVPFHYSRGESAAGEGLKAFVETPGYLCDTSQSARLVLDDGMIVAPDIKAARADASAIASRDVRWRQSIARRMGTAAAASHRLPSLQTVEVNAQFGFSTVSMAVAWQIAQDIGLIDRDERHSLMELQMRVIEQELGVGCRSDETRQTLAEMALEYRTTLKDLAAMR